MQVCEPLIDPSRECKELERLEIEVTRRCPLKCIHCSARASEGNLSNELSFKDIIKVISEFSELGGRVLTITGGEPLIRGKSFILDILNFATSRSLSTRIYTSGYLLNESVAKKLRDNGTDIVCVSIEGLKTTHDIITGVEGSYGRAVKALKLLHKYEISARIHFTPMKINYAEFQHVINLGEKLGVDDIKVFDFSPQGRGYDNRHKLELSSTEMSEFVTSVMKIMGQSRVNILFGGVIGGLSDFCSIGKKIAITCEGDTLPCLGLRERMELFGNFGNIMSESLLEIWRKIRRISSHNTCLCATLEASI